MDAFTEASTRELLIAAGPLKLNGLLRAPSEDPAQGADRNRGGA